MLVHSIWPGVNTVKPSHPETGASTPSLSILLPPTQSDLWPSRSAAADVPCTMLLSLTLRWNFHNIHNSHYINSRFARAFPFTVSSFIPSNPWLRKNVKNVRGC